MKTLGSIGDQQLGILFSIGQWGTEMPAIGLCKGALGETGQKIKHILHKAHSLVSNYSIGNFNTHTIIQMGTQKRSEETSGSTHKSSDHCVLPSI